MSLIKGLKVIRNHWKKSLFITGVFAYGVSYSKEKYEINKLMRAYCQEAVLYGDVSIDARISPKKILVILNPAANKRSAEGTFEKYCAPILHLGGCLINVIQTDSEGHARRYVEELEELPDAILIAGGDGTISEAVTGLMRRKNGKKCPIGILPVGRTNYIASKFFNIPYNGSNLEDVKGLGLSALSILRGKTTKKNIMKIQTIELEDANDPASIKPTGKPIYSLGLLQWGAFRDMLSLRDNYWYYGPLRDYASALFNAFSNKLTWKCKATIGYTPPCPGCKNCYQKEEFSEGSTSSTGRWWSRFIPKVSVHNLKNQHQEKHQMKHVDYSKVVNENCSKQTLVEIDPNEIILSPENDKTEEIPKLCVNVGKSIESGFDFISKSWKRISKDEAQIERAIEARVVQLIPESDEKESNDSNENQKFYSIDNEAYEVRPVIVSVVPKAIDLYVPE